MDKYLDEDYGQLYLAGENFRKVMDTLEEQYKNQDDLEISIQELTLVESPTPEQIKQQEILNTQLKMLQTGSQRSESDLVNIKRQISSMIQALKENESLFINAETIAKTQAEIAAL